MVLQKEHVLFSTPWSRSIQFMNSRKIENARERLTNFLRNYTTITINEPKSVNFTFTPPFESYEPRELVIEYRTEVEKRFNKKYTPPLFKAFSIDAEKSLEESLGVGNSEISLGDIHLEINELDKALDYMIEKQPWPKLSLTPVELIVNYEFHLLDINTKKPLMNAECPSFLLVYFSQNSQINVTLWFPYSQEDPAFWKYVKTIEKETPFKFDHKFLRSVKANKKGTDNVFRKLKITS